MYLTQDGGVGLVEYALILVLAVVVVVGILTVFGAQIDGIYSNIVGALPS